MKNRYGWTLAKGGLLVALIVMIAIATIHAKSAYLVADHNIRAFDAWDIGADGLLTKQATYSLQYAVNPAGIAIDAATGKYDPDGAGPLPEVDRDPLMFVTTEGIGGIEVINPTTLQFHGVAPGPINMGGLDADDADNILYAIQRGTTAYTGMGTNDLFIYTYNDDGTDITQVAHIQLPNMNAGFSLTLDDSKDILWVGDYPNHMVRAYNVNVTNWNDIAEIPALSFSVSHGPIDVEVDSKRGFVYTSGGWAGSLLLTKFNLTTRTETSVNCGGAMGIAVDEVTGLVYITRGFTSGGGSLDDVQVWDCSALPFSLLQDSPDLGNPAGIAIPNQGGVSYNPLNLAKNDVLQGIGVPMGQNFTYEITCDNVRNTTADVTGVMITDILPNELDFVSEAKDGVPGTGLYDPIARTVVWDIGTIPAGQTGPVIHLLVSINQNATPGSTINNFARIESDQTPPTTVVGEDPDDTTGTPGTIILPSTYTCYPNLPDPQLVFEGTEDYEVSGNLFTRYLLTVTNWADYPDELFEASPDLPACGLNTNSSRSWVNIFAGDNSYIYGFCALGVSANLQDIWFAVPRGECPPEQIYIEIYDRRCDFKYTSDLVPIMGGVFGQVSLCSGGGIPGVPVNLILGDTVIRQAITNVSGDYEFTELPRGDYIVELQIPLGMATEGESVVPLTGLCRTYNVNFCLKTVASGKVMDIWTWKTQLKAIKDGKKVVNWLTIEQVNRYGALIYQHMYNRMDGFAIQIPGVTFADGPRAMTFDDIYATLFSSIDTYKAKAERALLCNLLNIASARQDQLASVTVDGATACQAITYFAGLYNAGGTANYFAIYVNLQKMHMKTLMPAGVVPLWTPVVLYKVGDEELPTNFTLSQNYPNPFNPTTSISFSLPVASEYTLTIYNTVGQVVNEMRGHANAGETILPWDGSAHSSGVYLYRLQAGSFVDSKKMLLLK